MSTRRAVQPAKPPAPPPPFLTKTYDLVDDPSTDDLISWSEDGTSFVVWKQGDFSEKLLPLHFKHNNFSSFVRQLNTYGFRKVHPELWAFHNDSFKRGHPELLGQILRRKPTAGPSGGAGGHEGAITAAPGGHPGTPTGDGGGGSGGTNAPIEVGNYGGLWEEVDALKRDRGVLMQEVIRLRQQQAAASAELRQAAARLDVSEARSQQLLGFVARAMQHPAILSRLGAIGDLQPRLEHSDPADREGMRRKKLRGRRPGVAGGSSGLSPSGSASIRSLDGADVASQPGTPGGDTASEADSEDEVDAEGMDTFGQGGPTPPRPSPLGKTAAVAGARAATGDAGRADVGRGTPSSAAAASASGPASRSPDGQLVVHGSTTPGVGASLGDLAEAFMSLLKSHAVPASAVAAATLAAQGHPVPGAGGQFGAGLAGAPGAFGAAGGADRSAGPPPTALPGAFSDATGHLAGPGVPAIAPFPAPGSTPAVAPPGAAPGGPYYAPMGAYGVPVPAPGAGPALYGAPAPAPGAGAAPYGVFVPDGAGAYAAPPAGFAPGLPAGLSPSALHDAATIGLPWGAAGPATRAPQGAAAGATPPHAPQGRPSFEEFLGSPGVAPAYAPLGGYPAAAPPGAASVPGAGAPGSGTVRPDAFDFSHGYGPSAADPADPTAPPPSTGGAIPQIHSPSSSFARAGGPSQSDSSHALNGDDGPTITELSMPSNVLLSGVGSGNGHSDFDDLDLAALSAPSQIFPPAHAGSRLSDSLWGLADAGASAPIVTEPSEFDLG